MVIRNLRCSSSYIIDINILMVEDIDINNLVLNRIIIIMNRYDNYCADNKEFNVQYIKRDLASRLSN